MVQVIRGQGDKGNLQTKAAELPPVTPRAAPGQDWPMTSSQASEYMVDCHISYSPTSRETALKGNGAALAHLTHATFYCVCL